MEKSELIRLITPAEEKGFDLNQWFIKNYGRSESRETIIETLCIKGRYKNLLNDVEFIKSTTKKKKGGGKNV